MIELSDPVVDTAITCSNFDESARFCRELLSMGAAVDVQVPGDLSQKLGLAAVRFPPEPPAHRQGH